jgi:xylulose-5-phosphate/fructose-6-phosphate phosphoketolase
MAEDHTPHTVAKASGIEELLLTSHVWRQDHNGFSHQDPGFIATSSSTKSRDHPHIPAPGHNTLLSVTDHCLRSRNYVNVVIAGKNTEGCNTSIWIRR